MSVHTPNFGCRVPWEQEAMQEAQQPPGGGVEDQAWVGRRISHLRFGLRLLGSLLPPLPLPGPPAQPGEAGVPHVRKVPQFDSDAGHFAGGDPGEEDSVLAGGVLVLRLLQALHHGQDGLALDLVL